MPKSTCSACGKQFKSVTAFDRHRTGRFGVDRRCMTDEEMTARGFRINASGQWVHGEFPLEQIHRHQQEDA